MEGINTAAFIAISFFNLRRHPGGGLAGGPGEAGRSADFPGSWRRVDPLAPVSRSEQLAAALTKAGVPNRLVVIPGAGHDLDLPVETLRNLVFQILEFLKTIWNNKISQSLNL